MLGDPDVEFGIPGTGGYNKTVRELLDYYSTIPVTVFVITIQKEIVDNRFIVYNYKSFTDDILDNSLFEIMAIFSSH